MTENKLSESEIQEIREEAEKLYPLFDINECTGPIDMEKKNGVVFLVREAHIAALTRERLRSKEVVDGIEILKELCQLKHYKDEVGKDAFYEKTQPELWAKANEFLNNYKNNK